MKRESLVLVLIGALQAMTFALLLSFDKRLGNIESVLFVRQSVVSGR